MTEQLPQVVDRDAPVFTISVAASLAGMHPQTLRTYDRMGLVRPQRSRGRGRRYSPRDVARLRMVQHLSQDEGVNLEGVRRILDMDSHIDDLTRQLEAAQHRLGALQAAIAQIERASGRVFTAEASGAVHLGRPRRGPRELSR